MRGDLSQSLSWISTQLTDGELHVLDDVLLWIVKGFSLCQN